MKKIIIALVMVMTMTFSAQAQGEGFNLGAFIGVPVADGTNYASFSTGLDVNYIFEINSKFGIGPATGFAHSFGKKEVRNGFVYSDDFQYIPIAAAGRFTPNEKITIGLDLGFALGLNNGNDGGVYFRPIFGYNISKKVMLTASYRGVSLGGTRGYYVNNGNNGNGNFNYYDGYYGGTFSILSVGASFNLN